MADIRVGICGLGFMGKMHFDTYASMKGVKVVAIADCDPKKRKGDWSSIVGNIAAKGKGPNLKGVTMYATCEELINDPNIDVVDITLPTSEHARYALKSLKAGKPTICEKPMARTTKQARDMAAMSKKTGAPLFVGHCIRFWPEYVEAKKIIDSGKYGKVVAAQFTRFSLRPTWSSNNWLMDSAKSGGAALDLHIHDADYITYLFGMPDAVMAHGAGADKKRIDHILATYFFKKHKDALITAEGGWMYTPGFGFEMKFRIQLEKATILMGHGSAGAKLSICLPNGKVLMPKVGAGDGYSQELSYFMNCVKKQIPSVIVTPESSAASVTLIEAEMASAKAGGKKVTVSKK